MVEALANDGLSIGFFPGLGAGESAPGHSTLTLFKNRLTSNAGTKTYEELFNEVIMIAMKKEFRFGKLQVVDGVQTIANVNPIKDERRK